MFTIYQDNEIMAECHDLENTKKMADNLARVSGSLAIVENRQEAIVYIVYTVCPSQFMGKYGHDHVKKDVAAVTVRK